MKKTKNYINKKDFLEALVAYRNECAIAKSKDLPDPPMPNYIGECFKQIAEGVCKNWRFSRYTYKEEMISDGIMNCLLYFKNFDPEHPKANPFGYFSQYIFNAAAQRINIEKEEQYVKYMTLIRSGVLEECNETEGDEHHPKQFELYENIAEFIEKFEKSKQEAKEKKKKAVELKGLDKYIKK
jgi:hypothetical protein